MSAFETPKFNLVTVNISNDDSKIPRMKAQTHQKADCGLGPEIRFSETMKQANSVLTENFLPLAYFGLVSATPIEGGDYCHEIKCEFGEAWARAPIKSAFKWKKFDSKAQSHNHKCDQELVQNPRTIAKNGAKSVSEIVQFFEKLANDVSKQNIEKLHQQKTDIVILLESEIKVEIKPHISTINEDDPVANIVDKVFYVPQEFQLEAGIDFVTNNHKQIKLENAECNENEDTMLAEKCSVNEIDNLDENVLTRAQLIEKITELESENIHLEAKHKVIQKKMNSKKSLKNFKQKGLSKSLKKKIDDFNIEETEGWANIEAFNKAINKTNPKNIGILSDIDFYVEELEGWDKIDAFHKTLNKITNTDSFIASAKIENKNTYNFRPLLTFSAICCCSLFLAYQYVF